MSQVFDTSERLIELFIEKYLGQRAMSDEQARENDFPFAEYLTRKARAGQFTVQLDAKIWSAKLDRVLNCYFVTDKGEKFSLAPAAGKYEIPYGRKFNFADKNILPGCTFRLGINLSRKDYPYLAKAELLQDMREVLRARALFEQKAIRPNQKIRDFLGL